MLWRKRNADEVIMSLNLEWDAHRGKIYFFELLGNVIKVAEPDIKSVSFYPGEGELNIIYKNKDVYTSEIPIDGDFVDIARGVFDFLESHRREKLVKES